MSSDVRPQTRFGGYRTVAFFSGLLGLNEQDRYTVGSVTESKGHYEVAVLEAGAPVTTLVVSPAGPDQPSFVGTPRLSVVYRGETIARGLAELLQSRAFALHEDASIETLRVVSDGDPDAIVEGGEVEEVEEIDDRDFHHKLQLRLAGPQSFVADADAFADFLARYEILCQKVISMWLFNPCTLILHGDSECFGPPNLGLNMVMTINAPWDNRVRDIGRPRDAVKRVAEPRPEDLLLYVTDVRERDVIAGSFSKERQIFEDVFGQNPGLVVFFHACVGVVSGSDIEQVYQEHKKKHNMPVLYFRGGENRALLDFYEEVLVGVRKGTPHPADAPKNLVNLVGYSGHATLDLLEGLEKAGVTVNGILLPQVTVPPVVDFEKAALNVFLPNVDFENFYDQLLQDTGVDQTISPDAPYGVEGTTRWYRAIAEQAGTADRVDAMVDEMMGPHRAKWDALVERARQHRLTFVSRDFEIQQLLDSKFTYGIPVLEALAEMGFGLDLFLMKTDPKMSEWAEKQIAESLSPGLRVDVRWFATQEEMTKLLDESASRAVFTNLFFDWRATSAGKGTFSLQHFEAGYEGAVRTIDRLLTVCETPFHARYAKYLKRDRFGHVNAA